MSQQYLDFLKRKIPQAEVSGFEPLSAPHSSLTGWGIELNPEYWRFAVGFCEAAEEKINTPTLFDVASNRAA